MNFLNKSPLPGPVDLDKLREELDAQHPVNVPPAREPREYAPLQVIGHAITRLTYNDAVKMGEAIQAILAKDTGTPQNVTAAIQAWAADWDSRE